MIITQDQIRDHVSELGAKTLNLMKLRELGFNVPVFCALPSSAVVDLYERRTDSSEYQELVREIERILPVRKFIVRSSALIEDSDKASYAGQFLSIIDVDINGLAESIDEVIKQAGEKLNGRLELFSIIIQEYITADISGVCFTRDPFGNRNMVIEYHRGIGEDIVSGKIKPQRILKYWNDQSPTHVISSSWIELFKSIENHYLKPQDIEWLTAKQKFYIVQTRPITTIDETQYRAMVYLDKVLPSEDKYIYEKTEISEIAPRPTPLVFDLLQKIYSINGPVSAVYKKYGISYTPHSFLKVIGNELFVDREKEIKTLLPSYTYLKTGAPNFASFSGLIRTIKNIFYLNRLHSNPEELTRKINKALVAPPDHKEVFNQFLSAYELIFEVNLLAGKALKNLEFAAKRINLSPSLLLSLPMGEKYHVGQFNHSDWLGNSLEISDETPFYISPIHEVDTGLGQEAIAKLSQTKRNFLEPIIRNAQSFSRLRELGRWLTVKYINVIRSHVLDVARESGLKQPKNIYFSAINELGNLSEHVLEKRKQDYDYFCEFNFPSKLTNLQGSKSDLIAVSGGVATGLLKSAEQIYPDDSNIILYTKTLTPDLTKYFKNISGIISQQGGLLSHLAIIAREKGLPVIVNYDKSPPLGKEIKLDANSVSITE
jgi:phosphohistidine swiveling domain-containing protein